jgi:hypothetical protein
VVEGAALMRALAIILASILMTNCSGKSFPPQARVDIHVPIEEQAKVISAMKSFGSASGFQVQFRNSLPRQGRFVTQITLERNDGVVVSMSNFIAADTLQTFFYGEKPHSDWLSVKIAWMHQMQNVVSERDAIVEVSLAK